HPGHAPAPAARRQPGARRQRPHPRHPARALRLQAPHGGDPLDGHHGARRDRHAALQHPAGPHPRHARLHRGAHRGGVAAAPGRGEAARRADPVSPLLPLTPPQGRRPRVVAAFGTRPEANKMAPVVQALERTEGLEAVTLVTGQHREQLAGSLATFGLTPDADLAVMTPRQSLAELTGRIVPAAARTLKELRADYVLVHGDTSTTFCVALAAFLEGIPVAHVEAGLRSFDMAQPFPEEANRRLTDVLTDLDLPPTPLAKRHLLMEGKREAAMVVTGNTAVDAVQQMRRHARLPERVPGGRLVAVTMHRRENLPVMRELAAALAAVARANPDVTFVYPVHLNPAVREAVRPALGGLPNVLLEEPWEYLEM